MTDQSDHERLDEMAERIESLIRTNREFMAVMDNENPYDFDQDFRGALFP